ncbi:MAG: HNH endonuclease [Candidatus Hydrogenedentota bacterium]|nr:MAG: HNH endonuclease [Candidatus Hydrogenedentota bacterium]
MIIESLFGVRKIDSVRPIEYRGGNSSEKRAGRKQSKGRNSSVAARKAENYHSHMHTLVLNRNFYAIHLVDWKKAVMLLYTDRASVIDEEYRAYDFTGWRELSRTMRKHPSGFVHTPTFRIAVPEVIALKYYDKLPPMRIKFTRRNVYEHYRYRCCYCGKKFSTQELNLDHVIPRSRGGKSNWENVVTACIRCNSRKANMLPEEAGMRLKITPSQPRWRGPTTLLLRPGVKVKASWQKFVDLVYWDGELERE